MTSCSKCLGDRHLYDPKTGTWDRCSCLRTELRNKRFEAAGIPQSYWQLTLETLPALSPDLMTLRSVLARNTAAWKAGTRPRGTFLMYGVESSTVRAVSYLLLKAILFRYEGMWTTVEDLIEANFSKDKSHFKRARMIHSLVLYVGSESPNDVGKHMVTSMLESRAESRFFTLLVTTLPPPTLATRYGNLPLWSKTGLHITVPSEELAI